MSIISLRSPKLVMFDLDGTLVDSVPDLAAAVDCMLSALNRPDAGVELVSQWVGNGAEMLIRRALSGAMEPKPIDEELFKQARELFLASYAQLSGTKSTLYPGVKETLIKVKEQVEHIAIITNKPSQFTQSLLDYLELPGFDLVLSGDSLPTRKPDPAPLLRCLNQFECRPEEALMVGDSISDIKAAQAANVPVVAVSYGYHQGFDLKTLAPDYFIERFDGLVY